MEESTSQQAPGGKLTRFYSNDIHLDLVQKLPINLNFVLFGYIILNRTSGSFDDNRANMLR